MKFLSGLTLKDLLPIIKILLIGYAAWWIFGKIAGLFGKKDTAEHDKGVQTIINKGVDRNTAEKIQSNYESGLSRANFLSEVPGIGTYLFGLTSSNAAQDYQDAILKATKTSPGLPGITSPYNPLPDWMQPFSN